MDANAYDRWYDSLRGRWIGRMELALLLEMLQPGATESILDVGCGTGFFTRNLAARTTGEVVGVDTNPEWLALARSRGTGGEAYRAADARSLPFADRSFDLAVSITALCFIEDEVGAVREIARVTRRRFAIGLLHRRSLLWLMKGRGGGRGGYRGARWHTVEEAAALVGQAAVTNIAIRTAIHMPTDPWVGRLIEAVMPSGLRTGGFVLASADTRRIMSE